MALSGDAIVAATVCDLELSAFNAQVRLRIRLLWFAELQFGSWRARPKIY